MSGAVKREPDAAARIGDAKRARYTELALSAARIDGLEKDLLHVLKCARDAAAAGAELKAEPRAAEPKQEAQGATKSENAVTVKPQLNENNETFFACSATRRVTVRKFKSSKLIDIREFYNDAEGQAKPGKKGISLTLEQFRKLKAAMPAIEEAIEKL